MTSRQYEELCRKFVADQLALPVAAIRSLYVPNAVRPRQAWHTNLGPYRHQIDLYWEICSPLANYLSIANAKWRTKHKIHLQDVLLLQQVRLKVGAHKALMITNAEFTRDARRAAADEGIGLLIVRPDIDVALLDSLPRTAVQDRLGELATGGLRLYTWQVVQKGLATAANLAECLGQVPTSSVPAVQAQPYAIRSLLPPAPAAASPPNIRGAPGGGSPGGSGTGYATRQGPGLGFRTK